MPAAGARAATPGVTATQIVLGATGPLTGSESQYEPVLSGAKAYFDYVNDHGGVLGRKIDYKIEDDQYDPAQTVTLTQKLVEQDNVFAIFNSIGTEHALAVREYLNAAEGSAALRRQRRRDDRGAAQAVPVDDAACCRATSARARSTGARSRRRSRRRRSPCSTRTTSTARSCSPA